MAAPERGPVFRRGWGPWWLLVGWLIAWAFIVWAVFWTDLSEDAKGKLTLAGAVIVNGSAFLIQWILDGRKATKLSHPHSDSN